MADERIDREDPAPAPAAGEPVSDDKIEALADTLRQETAEADVRLQVTEASEHMGTGTDR